MYAIETNGTRVHCLSQSTRESEQVKVKVNSSNFNQMARSMRIVADEQIYDNPHKDIVQMNKREREKESHPLMDKGDISTGKWTVWG